MRSEQRSFKLCCGGPPCEFFMKPPAAIVFFKFYSILFYSFWKLVVFIQGCYFSHIVCVKWKASKQAIHSGQIAQSKWNDVFFFALLGFEVVTVLLGCWLKQYSSSITPFQLTTWNSFLKKLCVDFQGGADFTLLPLFIITCYTNLSSIQMWEFQQTFQKETLRLVEVVTH